MSVPELAWLVEHLCLLGLRARVRGYCWGLLSRDDLVLQPSGVEIRVVSGRRGKRSQSARARRHRDTGHDAGCAAVGVPRETIVSVLAAADHPGGSALLLEGLDEAIAIIGEGPTKDQDAAREAVHFSIARKITPRAPALHNTGRVVQDGRHGQW